MSAHPAADALLDTLEEVDKIRLNRSDLELDIGDLQEDVESLTDENNRSAPPPPDTALQQKQVIARIEQALTRLPARQREAFLLRYWEGMDITETAAVMGCTEGSVKTHCSRATHALAATLKNTGVELP